MSLAPDRAHRKANRKIAREIEKELKRKKKAAKGGGGCAIQALVIFILISLVLIISCHLVLKGVR